MRVLHVIQEMRMGGAERVVVSLAVGAAAAGHDVAVASGPGPLARDVPGPRYSLPLLRRRPWLVPPAALGLLRALRAWRPDLVHCHNPAMALVTSLATLRGRRPPALVSIHGVPDEDWPATARVLRLAALPAVACGPGVAAALGEYDVGVETTIWNAVGSPPPPADRAALEQEWGIEPGHRLVIAVGRLVPPKNHGLAVRALAAVPRATLAIVGEGPLREQLLVDARDAGVSERVVLAGLRPDARSIMAAADAVVLSSRSEGLPLALLEALAAGTPVVATAVRGVRELLTDERDALLVPPDDVDALGRALLRVLDEEPLAATIAAGGRRLAEEHSEEQMVGDFLALYERLAA